VEGGREASHPCHDRSSDIGGRARMGSSSCPAGRRSTVGQGKGVTGSSQDLRDREGRWSKDHSETRSYASRRA
jgi:hypothetical protein